MEGYTTKEMQRFNYLCGETDAAYHEAALRLGLADSTLQVLYAICNSGDSCLLSDICRVLGISKQTINSALRKMEGEGLIYLETAGGRKKRVCLTESGKELARRTAMRVIEIENDIFNSWSREELDMYLELAGRYLEAFRERVRKL